MAAPAFRSFENSPDGTSTDAAFNAPTGLANDDILLIFLYKENNAAVTWPPGFTQLATIDASDASHSLYCAWKRAASESGTYTASWTGSVWRDGILLCYSGADTGVNPFDAPTTTRTGSETGNFTAPSITTVTSDCQIIYSCGDSHGNTKTAPGTITQRSQNDDIVAGDKSLTVAGASGTAVWTDGGGVPAGTTGIAVALLPVGGGGGGPVAGLVFINPFYRPSISL